MLRRDSMYSTMRPRREMACDGRTPRAFRAACRSTSLGAENSSRSSLSRTMASTARSFETSSADGSFRPPELAWIPTSGTICWTRSLNRELKNRLTALDASASSHQPQPNHAAMLNNHTPARTKAAVRASPDFRTGLASAQAARTSGWTLDRMSSPSTASSSRSPSLVRRSVTAAWRRWISSTEAGASSQRARDSSPAAVRAVERSSNSDPCPKRSRSRE